MSKRLDGSLSVLRRAVPLIFCLLTLAATALAAELAADADSLMSRLERGPGGEAARVALDNREILHFRARFLG
ncbi:MAG TPA: hypothetical protein VF247_03840, partial [Candidatus Krumholzibacteria bacterium]